MILAQTLRMLLIAFMLGGGIVAAAAGYFQIGILMHAVIVAFLLTGTLNPSSRLFGPVQTLCAKGIWLTLDDGPDPTDTPAILDLLDRHAAKATFFVIGEKAAKHPELIREIHRRGHQLGNHSWSHPRLSFWRLGPVATCREIVKCQRVIKEITGEAPKIFRAPVGHYNIFVHPVLKQEGLSLIGWNSRGFDGGGYPLEEVNRRIRESAREGSIVLAHEATPIALEVVTAILALAKENGWEIAIPDVSPG
jgi:peptidoglycan/xylan/chitin deacetylase (PgdA/CDA1 family)